MLRTCAAIVHWRLLVLITEAAIVVERPTEAAGSVAMNRSRRSDSLLVASASPLHCCSRPLKIERKRIATLPSKRLHLHPPEHWTA